MFGRQPFAPRCEPRKHRVSECLTKLEDRRVPFGNNYNVASHIARAIVRTGVVPSKIKCKSRNGCISWHRVRAGRKSRKLNAYSRPLRRPVTAMHRHGRRRRWLGGGNNGKAHLLKRRQLQQIPVLGCSNLESRRRLRRVYVAFSRIRRASSKLDRADAGWMGRWPRMAGKRGTRFSALQTGSGCNRGGGVQGRVQRRKVRHRSATIPGRETRTRHRGSLRSGAPLLGRLRSP